MNAQVITVADATPAPRVDWTRWFPSGAPHGGWQLMRFETVAPDTGLPVGKAIVAQTPTLRIRLFRTEQLAQLAANGLNLEEGR
jgi:hypothetical protein